MTVIATLSTDDRARKHAKIRDIHAIMQKSVTKNEDTLITDTAMEAISNSVAMIIGEPEEAPLVFRRAQLPCTVVLLNNSMTATEVAEEAADIVER